MFFVKSSLKLELDVGTGWVALGGGGGLPWTESSRKRLDLNGSPTQATQPFGGSLECLPDTSS